MSDIESLSASVSESATKHGEMIMTRKGEYTFAFAANKWKEVPTKSKGTDKSKEYIAMADVFKKRWGNKPINEITDEDVRKFKAFLQSTRKPKRGLDLSAAFWNNWAGVYNAIMNHAAIHLKLIERFPLWEKSKEEERKYYPEPIAISRMRDELLGMGGENPLRADMLMLMFHTQLRNNNCTNLLIEEVAHDLSFIRIPGYKMKNGNTFERPLNEKARDIVRRNIQKGEALQERYKWLDPVRYVFVKDTGGQDEIGKPFSRSGLCNRQWRLARKRAGLPDDFVPHALRHAGASLMRRNGVSLPVIAQLLGHSDLKSTWRYQHVTSAENREASDVTASLEI